MVTKMIKKATKKLHSVSNLQYEQLAWQQNQVVCGVDEVGRGCLAGPVVAAAVIFPPGGLIEGVKDSKLLRPKQLLILAQKIEQIAWCGFGIINPYLIDNCNIKQATLLAMCRAIENLLSICPKEPLQILVDAMSLDQSLSRKIESISAPKGETWSYSIAAASIVAKVKRDRLMADYHNLFNRFNFDNNKGYGTAEHYIGLQQMGSSILHRQSFLKKFDILNTSGKQRELF